jgi:hypothetical protein
MLAVYYAPLQSNQVMAVYDVVKTPIIGMKKVTLRDGSIIDVQDVVDYDLAPATNSKVWTGLGFLLAYAPDGVAVTRDHRVTVQEEVVTAVTPFTNPVQPAPGPTDARRTALIAKLKADTITVAELVELLRLERGL